MEGDAENNEQRVFVLKGWQEARLVRQVEAGEQRGAEGPKSLPFILLAAATFLERRALVRRDPPQMSPPPQPSLASLELSTCLLTLSE